MNALGVLSDQAAIARAELDAMEPLVSETMSRLMGCAGDTYAWGPELVTLARRAAALERERERLRRKGYPR